MRLVSLAPGTDQRDRVVSLTEAGRARVRSATGAWKKVQRDLSAALGADAEQLVTMARRVTALARSPEAR
jgi:DNA-binding MarR family transcriptional regulator